MEFLGGGNLADRLARGPLPVDQAVRIFRQVGAALDAAHRCRYEREGRPMRGVVHRDVKPQNVCFDGNDRVVVVDFGLARLLDDPSTSGSIRGTPAYMAPEQWLPSGEIDPRTDIYALGVLLFEMVTGRTPFDGPNLEAVMRGHLEGEIPDARRLRPEVPPAVAEAIRRALAKERAGRHSDVAAFCEAVGAPRESPPDGAGSGTPQGPQRALATLARADDLARRDRFDDAILVYTEAVLFDPWLVTAFINRGYCYFRKRWYEHALADYNRALVLDPMHPEAYNNRGMVWKETGEPGRAAEDFRACLRFDPRHPLAPGNLASLPPTS
jgi:serine/threonine-protein kinase